MILSSEPSPQALSPHRSHRLLHLLLSVSCPQGLLGYRPESSRSWNLPCLGEHEDSGEAQTRSHTCLCQHPRSSPATCPVAPPSFPLCLAHLQPSPEPQPWPASLWSEHSNHDSCASTCHRYTTMQWSMPPAQLSKGCFHLSSPGGGAGVRLQEVKSFAQSWKAQS